MLRKKFRQTQRTKLSRSSKKSPVKRINRRARNRLRKIKFILAFLWIAIGIACIVLIIFLLNHRNQPSFISPVVLPVIEIQSQDELNLTRIRNLLKENNIPYIEISKLDKSSYKISLNSSSEVIISSTKNLKAQVSSLQYILSRLTMEDKRFSRLDLRFDKPVIVFY